MYVGLNCYCSTQEAACVGVKWFNYTKTKQKLVLRYVNVHRHLSADSTEQHLSKTVRARHSETTEQTLKTRVTGQTLQL